MELLPSYKQQHKNLHPDSSFTHLYWIIHQQIVCPKISKLDHMLSLVTNTVSYIRGRSLNHRQFSQYSKHHNIKKNNKFSQLLEDMDNQFTDFPFYTDVRWLSCHKVMKRFYISRQEIITFFEMKSKWNDLYLKLQGKNKLITQLHDHVECFIPKLRLWKSQVSNENFVHLPACKELKNSANTKSLLSLAKYGRHL